MNKLILITCMLVWGNTLYSQNLISALHGKWKVDKYSPTIKPASGVVNSTLEFKPDGAFLSEGIFFGNQKGTYRTDETRNVVVIETEKGITEWTVYLKNKVLRIMTVPTEKGSEVFLVLSRID